MTNNKPKVTIIGLGYVGLPLALAMAKSEKYDVHGFDIDLKKIESLKNGKNPLQDETVEFLDKYIPQVTYVTPDEKDKIKGSDIYVITVPTPVDEDYNPDYTPVVSACKTIAPLMEKGAYVILESTVNPGTCDEVVIPTLEEHSGMKVGEDFMVSHCPERINPGDSSFSVLSIPRNVGSYTQEGNKYIADFYRSFIEAPINEVSTLKVAEATKIVENTFRDVNIAFVNELAMSFDTLEIDVLEVIQGSSNKPFGFMPHFPGCGVGGHCIPVDPYYLIRHADKKGFNHRFLKTARDVNNNMPYYTIELLEKAIERSDLADEKAKNIKVGLLGITYKANIGDVRESPAIHMYESISENHECKFFDPYIEEYNDFETSKSLDELLEWADAIVLATNHKEFAELPKLLKKHKNVKVFVDGRNVFQKSDFSENLVYKGIGR